MVFNINFHVEFRSKIDSSTPLKKIGLVNESFHSNFRFWRNQSAPCGSKCESKSPQLLGYLSSRRNGFWDAARRGARAKLRPHSRAETIHGAAIPARPH